MARLVLGMMLLAGTASAQQISTGGPGGTIFAFGDPNTATYGQVFVAPVGFNRLETFSFWLNNYNNGAAVQFDAFVMKWDDVAGHAVGPILSQSGHYNGTSSASFVKYDFGSGADVTGGEMYVAFLNASAFIAANPFSTAQLGMASTGQVGGNDFAFFNNGSNFAALTSNRWDCPTECWGTDAAFEANFTATPEPATFVLMGTGLIGVFAVVRRRKQGAVEA